MHFFQICQKILESLQFQDYGGLYQEPYMMVILLFRVNRQSAQTYGSIRCYSNLCF
ncbi:hypothetical protein SAMN04487843_11881 [Methylobacterium sp. ap11]|nr:hypothetical protein SAMN04487843_11881 [Methylobacterium sp. ap11]